MADFVKHEPCPNCGSKDNLGVWDDGHKWCFGCGHYIGCGGIALNSIEQHLDHRKKPARKHHDLQLPADFTRDLPTGPLLWLKRYGLTNKEILDNGFGWTEQHERLICPVYNPDGSLAFSQGRTFSDNPDKPRYYTVGISEDMFHFIGNPSLSVVLTEDVLSAIKVARHAYSMPLWGSQISTKRAVRLTKLVKDITIWLDKDKAQYAIRAKERILPYFRSVQVIISELDPKEYNDQSICEFLSIAPESSVESMPGMPED